MNKSPTNIFKQVLRKVFPKSVEKRKNQRMLDFYGQFIEKGDTCFDIGANIGNRTAVFLELGCKVVTVEPQKACVQVLKEKFGQNAQVSIIEKAVGSRAGQEEMMIANMNEVSTLSKEFVQQFKKYDYLNWKQTEIVEVITLDQLIEEHGIPQFCKIDVEGYEPEVLKGLSQAIPCLSFEYTEPLRKDAEECVKILNKIGNYQFNYSTYESMKMTLTNWESAPKFLQRVANIPSDVLHGDIYAVLSDMNNKD